jgi:uncharacterized protein YndB with AHSA1/START domain
MTLESFESTTAAFASNGRPMLQCAPPGTADADHDIRIHARRLFPAARDDLFAAWTTRTGWESWLRLRARSHAIVAPYPDGVFHLQLAEGPRIHVITAAVRELRLHEFISFMWIHHDTSDHASVLDVAFSDRLDQSELLLIHRSITSRREAAWLMRLWTSALDRLGRPFALEAMNRARARDFAPRITDATDSGPSGGGTASVTDSRCASSAA